MAKIIPCLDMANGRVTKGINFVALKDVGDPVEIAKAYSDAGADEIVMLDIKATNESRATMLDVVRKIKEVVTIPFIVGGGIRNFEDAKNVFDAGADKVSVNSAIFNNPDLINEIAGKYGSEKLIAAIDVKKMDNYKWNVVINGGEKITDKDMLEWAMEVERRGAGEILLTSMDKDGTKEGFDIGATRCVASGVKIPVTASGGAGCMEDFKKVIEDGLASNVLAASLFHYNEVSISELKEYLKPIG